MKAEELRGLSDQDLEQLKVRVDQVLKDRETARAAKIAEKSGVKVEDWEDSPPDSRSYGERRATISVDGNECLWAEANTACDGGGSLQFEGKARDGDWNDLFFFKKNPRTELTNWGPGSYRKIVHRFRVDGLGDSLQAAFTDADTKNDFQSAVSELADDLREEFE
jgi:hypothetical protein